MAANIKLKAAIKEAKLRAGAEEKPSMFNNIKRATITRSKPIMYGNINQIVLFCISILPTMVLSSLLYPITSVNCIEMNSL